MDLLAASDYLQMLELKEICLDEVPGILEPANAIEWWKEARKLNYDDVKVRCEEIIANDFYQVSQQTDFLKLDFDEVERITNICRANVGKDEVLYSIAGWVSP